MRLDKFIAENTGLTRVQTKKVLRNGEITVNGQIEKKGAVKIAASDEIIFAGQKLAWVATGQYWLLYKPMGYVCTHHENDYPTIFEFFDYPLRNKLHCAGRLDLDTTGLVLLTDDGQWSHRITSPKHHCRKTYLVTLADPIEAHYSQSFAQGILLKGEKTVTQPAVLEIIDDYNANLTISEGRYHQVKRMFAALGNKVVALHRWKIGTLVLDAHLQEGEYRPLTEVEKQGLFDE